jgi:hypothetical protein
VWYAFVGSVSNYPRRPHALTVANTTNSVFHGVRFLRSQMWYVGMTISLVHSLRFFVSELISEKEFGPSLSLYETRVLKLSQFLG